MKTLIVTEQVINELSPYQGQTKQLKIGERLFLIFEKVACVRQRPDYKDTFSILTDKQPYKECITVNTDSYYNANRWSLNDKFKKLIA